MRAPYPIEDRIYVLKDGESLGPFEIDEILEYVESGQFRYDDVCLREGAIETERLRDVLDWEDSSSEEAYPEEEEEEEALNEPSDTEAAPESLPPSSPDTVLYQGHRSILSYPTSFLGLIAGVVGSIWLYPIDSRLMLLSLTVSAFALAYLTLMRFTQDYLITPRRIEQIKGLIARSSNEVRISDIRAINVSCTGLIGILGVGTVDFFTTGDAPEVSFKQIWGARDVKKLVRRLQDDPH